MGTNEPTAGVDGRQLLLVCLCVVALVVAAFLAPVATPFGAGDGAGGGDGSGGGAEQTDAGGSGQSTERRTGGNDGGGGEAEPGETGDGDSRQPPDGGVLDGTNPVPIPGGTRPPVVDGCGVVIDSRPVPGDDLTISVYRDLEPATNTRVWVNGDFAGRTDAGGNITVRVPYSRTLNVTVESPTNEPCEFYRYPYDDEETDGEASQAAVAGTTTVGAGALGADRPFAGGLSLQQTTPEGDNSTGEYEVYGEVDITIEGEPYPGATVVLNATVEDVPMRAATVSVDGERVGETDERGEYRLTVPDSERTTVTVERGAFNGTAVLEVLQLDIGFSSADPFVVPGDRAAVTVARDDGPVENATVTVQGERLGTTDQNGRLGFRAPAALGTVTASTDRQTATVPMLRAFAGTIGATVVLGVLALLTTVVTAGVRGRESAVRVAVFWAAVGWLFVAFAVGEWVGLAGAAAVVVLLALYRYRSTVRSGGASTASWLRALLDGLRRGVLWVVGALEGFVDWAVATGRRVAAWVGSLPRSVSALARRFGAWLAAVPARLLAGLRRLPLRALLVVTAAVALVVVATRIGGVWGFIGSVAVLAIAALGWWYRRRSPEASEPADGPADSVAFGHEVATGAVDSLPSVRDLWRRLARRVLPERWRTSTPAEVSRAAVDRGLPREPVERLAEAFREVEYGGRAAVGYRETVRTAYEALSDAEEEER